MPEHESVSERNASFGEPNRVGPPLLPRPGLSRPPGFPSTAAGVLRTTPKQPAAVSLGIKQRKVSPPRQAPGAPILGVAVTDTSVRPRTGDAGQDIPVQEHDPFGLSPFKSPQFQLRPISLPPDLGEIALLAAVRPAGQRAHPRADHPSPTTRCLRRCQPPPRHGWNGWR